MAALNDKGLDRLNNLPAAQRERKTLYIAIYVLAGVIAAMVTYWRVDGQTRAEENKQKDEQIALMQAKIDACNEGKTIMERDFRAEIKREVNAARNELLGKVMPVVEGRERRADIMENELKQIRPKLKKASKNTEQLYNELNKIRKP